MDYAYPLVGFWHAFLTRKDASNILGYMAIADVSFMSNRKFYGSRKVTRLSLLEGLNMQLDTTPAKVDASVEDTMLT